MNFRDHFVTDEEGNEFVFTVEMQRSLSQAGLPVEPAALSELKGNSHNQQPKVKQQAPPPKRQEAEEDDFPTDIQIDPQTGKYLGRLKWYNPVKGYGFIARGGGEDIFFHKTAAVGDPRHLNEGQWVLYDVEERRKGLEATDVEPYEGDLLN